MTAPSIAACINFYNDAHALRGAMESAAPFFDHIFTINAGPGGKYSTDGSIELVESFGATVVYDDMQRGFGAIRTRLIHDCGCTWAFILDADERFHPRIPVMHCEGEERYPDVQIPNLSTFKRTDILDQGGTLKGAIISPKLKAIRTSRRHWFDFTMNRPSQNWIQHKDYQLRIVKNLPEIGYETNRVMHERLRDSTTGEDPVFGDPGIFHDHYHLYFRNTFPGSKELNEERYARLERGEPMIE